MATAKLDTIVPTGAPSQDGKAVPAWMPVVDHVLERLPDIANGIKRSGIGGHIVALWLSVAALTVVLVAHLAGDGSLRAKVDRTECAVEWLVAREMAKDRGESPPPFTPHTCPR